MENVYIVNEFEKWILSIKKENTKKMYRRIILQFFQIVFQKKINEVTVEDIQQIKSIKVNEIYIDYLRKEDKKDQTIRTYFSAVREFFDYVSETRQFEIDYKYITEKVLCTENLKKDSVVRKKMTKEDYKLLKQWFLDKKYAKRYGNLNVKYALVVELLWTTSIRIDEAFTKLTWEDIKWEKDSFGRLGWNINLNLKEGETVKKPISIDFYDRLHTEFFSVNETLVLSGASKQSFSKQIKEYSIENNKNFTSDSIRLGSEYEGEFDRTKTGSYIMTTHIDDSKFDLLSKNDILSILNKREDLKREVLAEYSKMNKV